MAWSEPHTVMLFDGPLTAVSDEDAIAQYHARSKARWDELRADALNLKIMDSDGNIHPLPDPGPYPGDMAAD